MFVSRTGLFGCLARWSKSSLANWNQLGLQEGCSWARGRSRVSSFRLDLGQTLGPRPMVRLRGAGRCRVWHERLTLCIAEGSLTSWDCWALLGSVELPCVHYVLLVLPLWPTGAAAVPDPGFPVYWLLVYRVCVQ